MSSLRDWGRCWSHRLHLSGSFLSRHSLGIEESSCRQKQSCDRGQRSSESRMSDEEQKIHALFDGADRALMAADIEALSKVFADDYVQYDPAGRPFSKREVLE